MGMKVLLLAGEESGVVYARRIADEIRLRRPDAEIRGYGDYGFKTGDLAVMGFVQVLRRLFFFMRVKRTMLRAIAEWRPDVVCTVDYPGMNLRLAAAAKRLGVRAVHVVCPQVWAWHRGRIPRIERSLDRLCCFFPFEPQLFRQGLGVFVGHPLVDEMERERGGKGEKGEGRGADGPLLAVLPGSRIGEIRHHIARLAAVVAALRADVPGLRVVVPAANEKARRAILAAVGGDSRLEVTLGGARELLLRADAAVVASGTATLEAALARCPTVLVYHVDLLFEVFCRIALKGVRHIGLINIVCEKAGAECPMPELMQQDFTVENVVGRLRPWLTDASANAAARAALDAAARLMSSDGRALARIAAVVAGDGDWART